MTAAIGTLGQLGIDDSGAATIRFNYESEALVANEEFVDGNGIRGTRSRFIDRLRGGLIRVGGPIVLQPNAVELSNLLEWICGASPSGSGTVTYALSDTLPSRDVTIDRVVKVHTFTGCKVDKATFEATEGRPLKVTLDLIGQTETIGNAGTFPTLSIDTATGPFMMQDLVLTLNSLAVTCKTYKLVIDNMIDKERYFNSRTLSTVETLDRVVTLETMVPYGDWQALYNVGPAGFAASAVFTNGGAAFSMSMVKVAMPRQLNGTEGRKEIMLPLTGNAWKSGSTMEVVTTLNVGP